jgi:hypothetical protein
MKMMVVVLATAQSDAVEAAPCDPMGCGVNGIWLGGNIAFHELHAGVHDNLNFTDAELNSAGLKIVSFKSANGTALRLRINGDELVGETENGRIVDGRRLVGAKIHLKGSPFSFTLKIESYDCVEFWAGSQYPNRSGNLVPPKDKKTCSKNEVPVYTINFTIDGIDKTASVCGPDVVSEQPLVGRSVIFRGDRYLGVVGGPAQITETGANDSWFNVACAGTAIAKLHLNRHTLASGDNRHVTNVEQRTALLRMLTADYCGNGRLFTVNGHELRYRFRQSWPLEYPQYSHRDLHSIEATWNQNGAVCLNVPRLADREPLATLRNRITQACGQPPPPCPLDTVTMKNWKVGLDLPYAISANPKPFIPIEGSGSGSGSNSN